MHVLILGAGIIGLTTAWQLVRDGHRVTVIDRNPGVGQGASYANGAQLSYSYVAPIASAAVLRALPGYLLRPGAVRFQPAADPAQWAWLIRFLAACTDATSAANTARLLALSFHSRDRLNHLEAETGIEFGHARDGKLVIQSSAASQSDAVAQMHLQAAFGCDQTALDAAQCIALEPALSSIADRLAGGILTPGEESGDCRQLCEGLHAWLTARGAHFVLNTEAHLAQDGRRIAGVDTSAGRLTADLYVLAAGTGSTALARAVKSPVPVLPIRGYSISAPIRASNRLPVRSITDTARKTVYARLGDRMRVAGFAEIGGARALDLPARSANLSADLQAIFPGACLETDLQPWVGLRPATPTGVPLIGPSRIDNLWFNLGQGSLGFTLAAGSASLLGDLLAARTPAVAAADYAPPLR